MEGTWSLSVVADYWLPVGFGRRGIWVVAYSERPLTPARDPELPLDLDGSGSPAEVKADVYSPSFRVWYTGFAELRGLNAAESRTDAIMFPLVTGMMACDPIRLQKIPQ